MDERDRECIHGLAEGSCSYCKPRPRPPDPPRRVTTTPRSADDPVAPLGGSKDISIPMYALDPYLGARTDWLVAQGYPHDLHRRDWVYLRLEDRLAARVRARGMRWREERPVRNGDDLSGDGFGPGLVFDVDPDTWEPFNQALGEDAERMRQGYRYHLTDRAGVVRHVIAQRPIPEGDWDTDG